NRALFDLRMIKSLEETNLLTVGALTPLGIEGEEIVFPGDADKSILYHRLASTETSIMMPPFSKNVADTKAVDLIFEWINQMEGESTNERPVAVIATNSTQGPIPLEVQFTGSGATDDVAVTSYLWNFKDGSPTSAVMNPVHVFTEPGIYMVELTVADEEGLTHTATVKITASTPGNDAPMAVIEANPINGQIPLEVTFDGSNSTDDGEVIGFEWNFDDGSASSTEMTTTHRFESAGVFNVALTVSDSEGLSDMKSVSIVAIDSVIVESRDDIVGTLIANPASEIAQVRLMDYAARKRNVLSIYVHDSSGRQISIYNPKDLYAHGLYEIPVTTLSKGNMYFIGFEMDRGERVILKLIVQ
ncbi:MAG: PKD domain-containing protein, partial [Flavobacteriaceae bacterium]